MTSFGVSCTTSAGSVDPGSIGISAIAGSVVLAAADIPPLAVAAANRPLLGTTWNLSVTNVPATGTLGVVVFGLSDPGIDDLFFLGMPGCDLRAALDSLSASIPTGPVHNYGFAVPGTPTLVGIALFTSAVVFESPAQNPFGAITANGIRGAIGSL